MTTPQDLELYRKMDILTVTVRTLHYRHHRKLSGVQRVLAVHTGKLNGIQRTLTQHGTRFDGIDGRLDGIDNKLDKIIGLIGKR